MLTTLYLILFFLLLGHFALTTVNSAFRHLRHERAKLHLKELGSLFFYRQFHRFFFPKKEPDALFLATLAARHLTQFFFAAIAVFLLTLPSLAISIHGVFPSLLWGWLVLVGLAILSLIIGDLIPRAWASFHPTVALKICAPIASFFLFICFPLTYLLLKLPGSISRAISIESFKGSSAQVTEKIIELLQESDIKASLETNDRKLLESVLTFKDRIVREVMIPRVNVFSLSSTISVKEAAEELLKEGYSRVPIYRESVDDVIGVVMYKDILGVYRECVDNSSADKLLSASVESLVKPVFYTPETKKVSQLLQEFRNKKIHLAIVVDEYGGTEGIVTIEDILEEIVGDIADEYDDLEMELFTPQPSGGWIVDARMSILDIEEKCHIDIPQDGDYDTLGGYIYYYAGTIPKRGFRISHNDFELEVMSSTERAIEKVKIIPRDLLSKDRDNDTSTQK